MTNTPPIVARLRGERWGSGDLGEHAAETIEALLSALEEVDRWRMQSLNMMPPEIRGAWMRAHAAIAKARGA
jgi:hypothetical protein